MKKNLFTLFFSLLISVGFAQLQIAPAHPTVNDRITFTYSNDAKVKCIVYFTGFNDRSKEREDFPKAIEMLLTRSGNSWSGEITSIPKGSTAIVFAFVDSLNHQDTNKGLGYYTPLYSNEQPLAGAWAGIGSLIYGNFITKESPHHIKYDLDSLKKFLNKDFSAHPEVKREYFRQYLESFKIDNPEQEQVYRKELEELAGFPQLTRVELNLLSFQYGRLKDTTNANKYNRLIYERYPTSSWTLEGKSMNLLGTVLREQDFKKQAEAYSKFKTTYLKPYPEEKSMFSMSLRGGQMLSYMVNHFAEEGTIDLWINETEMLTNDGKRFAYMFGARNLLGLNERTQKAMSSKQLVEHPFLMNNVEDLNSKTKIAEDLARRGVDVSQKALDGPRRINEYSISTDAEIAEFRNGLMSGPLQYLGISLMRQKRFSEAVDVLTMAVNKNHYKDSEINQTYVESLVRAGEIDKALSEIEKIVSMGKSTRTIDEFYAKYKKKGDDLSAFKDQSMTKFMDELKNKMIKEDLGDFVFYDLKGSEIKSSTLKNKIVVIDFWASWCPPCMITLNAADDVIEKYKGDDDVVFLLMGIDESKEKAMKTIEKHKAKTNFVFDKNLALVKKVSASVPAQLVIDKKGKVRFRTNGLSSFNVEENATELQAMIEMVKRL